MNERAGQTIRRMRLRARSALECGREATDRMVRGEAAAFPLVSAVAGIHPEHRQQAGAAKAAASRPHSEVYLG